MSEKFIRCINKNCIKQYKILSIDSVSVDYARCESCGKNYEEVTKNNVIKYMEKRKLKPLDLSGFSQEWYSDFAEDEYDQNNYKKKIDKKPPIISIDTLDKTKNIMTYVIIIVVFILMVMFADTADGPPRFFKDSR